MDAVALSDASFRDEIARRLEVFYDKQRPLFESISPDALKLIDSLESFTRSGKRFRAAFAYWGYKSAGGQEDTNILNACVALEMLQACALIHDDVMDASEMRRGRPSTHIEFANLHAENCATGDASAFGQGAAILLGDLALAWADELLESANVADSQKLAAKELYNTMRSELMAGQYLDLLIQQSTAPTIEQIRNVMRFKSAKYTIERPLHLGACLAGADEDTMSTLSTYGLALGEAFQLRDDLLGVFGQTEVTGKPVGDDLREGKQTLLIAYARAALSASAYSELSRLLGDKNLTEKQVIRAQEILLSAGVDQTAELQITQLLTAALSAIDNSNITKEAKTALANLAVAATQRKV